MTLGAGSIAFTGFNADGNDNLAFAALTDLASGTVLYFTDNEWNGTTWVDFNENTFALTLTSNVAAGNVVTIDNANSTAITSNFGTVAAVSGGGTNTGVGASDEMIYVYLADAATPLVPTTFLTAVSSDAAVSGSLENTGLTYGVNALDLSAIDTDADIAAFTGARNTQATFANYAAILNTATNWIAQDGGGDQSIDMTAPDVPFSTTAFTISAGGETQSAGFAAGSLNVSQNEGNSGSTTFNFTVQRTGGTTGQLDFSGTIAAGTTDGGDFFAGVAPTLFSGSIPDGAASVVISTFILGDTVSETTETFSLTLTTATNAAAGVTASVNAGAATANATIVNDDFAVPALGLGDIAFTGFNADGNDNIAFVALKAINAGETIFFTDNEWQGAAFNTGETVFSWTASANVAAGTVVTIDSIGTGTATSALGTVVFTDATNRGLAAGSDIVYAYVAASPSATPTFLAAVTNDSLEIAGTPGDADFATATNTGLVIGTSAIALASSTDIGAYQGSRSNQTAFADYAAAVNTVGNWAVQQGSGDQSVDMTFPDVPFSTTSFTLAPPGQTVAFSATAVSKAEGDAGARSLTFTVSRAGGTTGDLAFTGTFAAGTTDAADFGGSLPTFGGTIAAGQTSTTVTISYTGDLDIESNEAFSLTLTGGSNTAGAAVTVGTNAVATGTILNDDAGAVIGGITVFDAADSTLQGSTTTPTGSADIVLVRLGSLAGGSPAGAESVAYEDGKIYSTNINGNTVNVHSLDANGALTSEAGIVLTGLTGYGPGRVNSVAVKDGVIAVVYENAVAGTPGYVALFDAANGNALIKTIQVGVLPDMVTFSPDGSKILVANEGEALSPSNSTQGSVSIIDMTGGAANAAVINTIGFSALDGSELALAKRGLTLAPGQSASGDIEPEYITVSPDGTRAYVTLQEVNAVAAIDLTDAAATAPIAILPLGTVDWSLPGNKFDPSDQDNGSGGAAIKLVNADVMGVLQPDAITSFAVGGLTYFITANEGDSRVGGITDSVRLSSSSYVLDPTAYPDAAALKANASLGRLNVLTNVGDTDGDGDYDQIHTLGGRGITIFRQNADGTITKVRETGGEFEAITAALVPGSFNSNQSTSGFDGRSDDKGPEPEGVTVGTLNGRTYAFVGLERVGGQMVYDVTDPANASFVGYKPQTGADLGPETSTFVSAANSPTGGALLITAQEVSNTVTVYAVVQQTDKDDTLNGGADADTFNGKAGRDVLNGNGGNDILDGGTNRDTMTGGAGNDTYYVDNTFDEVIENAGEGTDTIIASNNLKQLALGAHIENATLVGAKNLSMFGNELNNVIIGNDGNNRLGGADGNDNLSGGMGNDTIIGGLGTDTMTGGAGADRFVFEAIGDTAVGAGRDVINGFEAGIDRIALSAIDADATRGGNQAFRFIGDADFTAAGQLSAKSSGGVVVASGDIDGDGVADFEIQISGVSALSALDFIL